MSEDVPVFRSDAPHQLAVPQVGGDAVSPQASHGEPGEARKIVDNVAFAPLDEPKVLSELELVPEPAAERTLQGDAAPEVESADSTAMPDQAETPADRARRIRRLSPELMDRAESLRAEIEATAVIVDAVIASFADFNPDALGLPDPSDPQGVLPDAAAAAEEPA